MKVLFFQAIKLQNNRYFYSSGISGTIPTELGNLANLQYLYIVILFVFSPNFQFLI